MSSPSQLYTPAPLLITRSRLTEPDLVTHFQDFSNSLQYVATAPELVFERLVGNLSDSLHAEFKIGQQEGPNANASQPTSDNLAVELDEKSTIPSVADEKFATESNDNSSALRATIESFTAKLEEATGALQSSQLAIKDLIAECQVKSSTLQASELENQSVTERFQEKCRELQASLFANKQLAAGLAELEEKVPAPGLFMRATSPTWPSIVDSVKVLVKVNPSIGVFSSLEVRPCQPPLQRTSKTITFANKYAMVPGLLVGLTTIDFGPDANIRVKAYLSEILRDRFQINLDSWSDTKKFYQAACMWLAIEANDLDFQYGSYHTIEDHDCTKTPLHNSRQIRFKRAYAAPPTVVVWLNLLDLGLATNWRIKCFATHVTATGFTIHIDTWSDTKLHCAMASWVAYPADRPGVASGSVNTMDTRSPGLPQVYNSAFEPFKNGVFDKPPRVFLALNAFDARCSQTMRLLVKVDNVSDAGMSWHLNGWGATILYSAGASYIAFS